MHSIRSLIATLSLGLAACVEASAPPAKIPTPENALMSVSVSPLSMFIAKGETGTISLTALNILGDTILPSDSTSIKWTSSDTLTASVDSNGVVTAHEVTTGTNKVTITGKWTQYGVSRDVNVAVYVTTTRLPIASLRIVSRDSTRTSFNGTLAPPWNWVSIVALNAQGDSIMAPFLTLKPTPSSHVAPLGILPYALGDIGVLIGGAPYVIMSRHIGDYWLYTEAMVYGTMMRDSLKFTGLYTNATTIQVVRDSVTNMLISPRSGTDLIVQPCGSVNFQNQSQTPIDIIFDDSTETGKCVAWDQTGNISNILPGATAARKFPAVGTIQWTVRDRNTGQLVPATSGKVSMRNP